ncbi:MAG: glycosyltransferase family 1 protein, partial [Bacteroidia bacterium]|nr:glycosyltransferase family 1 protein [Bacteroidia bacterium]
ESKIEFVGWLNDDQNREWYAKSKIFVSIPKSDGTSVSVLEAMSAECVLVLSDLPVTHEWISVKTGVIEQPEINPLIKAIAFCDSTILSQNKEFVDSIASRENSIQKFLHLYKEISKP